MGPHSHPPSALSQDVPRVPNAAALRPPLEEAEAMKAALRDAQSETLHFKKEIRSSVAELADRCTLPPHPCATGGLAGFVAQTFYFNE